MAIVYQTDKRSGITYAYQSVYHWDKEKRQSRCTRTLLGRADPITREITSTDGRGQRGKQAEAPTRTKSKASSSNGFASRCFYGATYLLDSIGEKTGVSADLAQCFPESFKHLLSIAYYLIMENDSPLFRFERWGSVHRHPFGKNITSQRSSDLFASITEERKNAFFHLQSKRRTDNEYWAYDTTSISSASELLRQVQYGKNKENEKMPQLNLALVFGEESNLPFYYRKLAGNVPDCRTLLHLLSEFDVLGFPKAKIVMDRGFYSEANINELLKNHIKFLISTKMTISFVRNELDIIYDGFRDAAHFYDEYGFYAHTVPIEWEYRQNRPYRKDVLIDKRRCYLHLYYNIEQAAEEELTFDRHLMVLRRELQEDRRVADNEPQYQKYFLCKDTPKRGVQVSVIQDAVNRNKRYLGYFALLGNEKMDAMQALETYRNKDVVEKAFGNLKERLSMRRMLVSSEKSLDGKLFIQFIALIYLSYIKKRMQQKKLFGKYTLQEVFDKLDPIECYENQGRKMRVSEISAKQRQLYLDLGVDPPKSSL